MSLCFREELWRHIFPLRFCFWIPGMLQKMAVKKAMYIKFTASANWSVYSQCYSHGNSWTQSLIKKKKETLFDKYQRIFTNGHLSKTNISFIPADSPYIHAWIFKTKSTSKLSNFNYQWTKTLYQNNLNNIAFFLHFSTAINIISYL